MRELDKEQTKEVINEILTFLHKDKRNEANKNINDLVNLFEGQDMNTLGVLYNSAEKGRFEEFYKKLKDYYENDGKNVSVNNRVYARNVGAIILEDIVKKETEIANKERDPKDRKYWPRNVQMIAEHLDSVKMELFFLNCYREIAGERA
jgi:hypothetical protein